MAAAMCCKQAVAIIFCFLLFSVEAPLRWWRSLLGRCGHSTDHRKKERKKERKEERKKERKKGIKVFGKGKDYNIGISRKSVIRRFHRRQVTSSNLPQSTTVPANPRQSTHKTVEPTTPHPVSASVGPTQLDRRQSSRRLRRDYVNAARANEKQTNVGHNKQCSAATACSMFMFRSRKTNLVRRLAKARKRRPPATDHEDSVHGLLRRLQDNQLEMLLAAVESRGRDSSHCVLVAQNGQVGREPHVLCCQSWRWPDLRQAGELRRLPTCRSACDPVYVCCNPYHWSRLCQPGVPLDPNFNFTSCGEDFIAEVCRQSAKMCLLLKSYD
ncbi:unnamed protein product [Phaedon cochleariae]|uniref:MH1 domain-containing protein n=1 Tax=Phaedon cochleariae TaxID=80249 RepID=A0A9N9SDN2_PHACE|nr:unnamed protein product [Phaedon cochleariae]